MQWTFEIISEPELDKMKTFTVCFVALFAGALGNFNLKLFCRLSNLRTIQWKNENKIKNKNYFIRTAIPVIDDDNDFFGNDVEFNFEDEIFEENFRDNEDKIVGGNETTIEKHPHQVSFRSRDRHICGGSVISATVALTAAHCLTPRAQPSVYSIMAGSTLRTGDANAQIRILSRFMRHPQFNPNRISNDVGLVFWEQPLIFGATVRAIALPQQSEAVPYGENCTVSGWGTIREGGPITVILNAVTKPIVSNEECNRAYGGRITDDMMCAGLPEGGRDACQGDSGGPLLVDKAVLGVVSWGRGCARPGFPGVYTRVSFFTNWIRENM